MVLLYENTRRSGGERINKMTEQHYFWDILLFFCWIFLFGTTFFAKYDIEWIISWRILSLIGLMITLNSFNNKK